MGLVLVEARDANGKVAERYGGSVTLVLATNPGGATLSGTTTVNARAGVATFSDLTLDKAERGYRLIASADQLTPVTSSRFDIIGGPATHLTFSTEPSTTAAGGALSLGVTARDALGNVADGYTGAITVAISPGTGTSGANLLGTMIVSASAGVATFSVSVDTVGSGYMLRATAAGLVDATSSPFDIVSGSATQLMFLAQPSNVIAGEPIDPPVVVIAQDAQGNTATGYTGNITVELTVGTGTPGANLLGTRTMAAVGGVATFSALMVNRSGAGYTLSARASNLTGATSTSFANAPAAVTQLVFTTQPATTGAGVTLTPAVQVAAQDSFGNTVLTFTDNVILTISANPANGTLWGTTTRAAVGGVATFPDLNIDMAGTGYRLDATAGGWTRTSGAFSITASAATHLGFTVEPTTTAAGASISPSVRVAGLDQFGNVAPMFTGTVTIAIGANPAGGTLSGTTVVAAASGVAVFSGLRLDKAGNGYTFSATTPGLTGATSAPFDIFPESATRLAFSTQPSNATAGEPITPAVVVFVQDAQGNTVPDFTGNVTMELTAGTGTAGANLRGTRTVAAVGGVATFSTLNVNRSGTGYTLSVRSSGLTGATSTPFDVAPAAMFELVFTTHPATSTAGATITPAVQVAAQDSMGNTVTGFAANVTLAIAVNPGSGTLSGTATRAAVAGVATFSNLSIDKAGTGYRLDATSGSWSRTSNAFSINPGAATQLGFTVQPSTVAAGSSISPSVRVAGLDAFGNTATSYVGNITIAIASNPAGGTLSGTTTVTAASGVAIFSDLKIDRVGNGYTLRATASGLTQATSAPFDVVAASGQTLFFTTQPSNATAGATIPTVRVTARDAQGNTATGFIGNVTLVITGGTGTAGASLSGTKTVAAVAGVATFSDLSINRSGTGYTLTATASGLTGAVSAAFTINAGSASVLVFSAQPQTTTAGATLTPAVQVTAEDALGNTATSFTNNVTLTISVNPGPGTLSGTTTRAAAAGVATFSNLSIDKAGTGYRLQASGGGLAAVVSNAFSINPGSATKLGFTVQPSTTAAGSSISPSMRVAAEDAFGNTATSYAGNITIAILTNPAGGTLSGTTTVTAAAGVAIFSGVSIDKVGTGYTIRATASGLTQTTSAPFDIVAASADHLVFTTQPSTTTAGVTMATVRVTARDAQGNTATSFSGTVTVAIGTNPGGGTLSGTLSVSAVSGVATFSTLSINRSGTGYTLTANASGVPLIASTAFNINPGSAAVLLFTAQPQTTTAGTTLTPAVQVTGEDALGNVATGFTGSVTMTISVNPGGGTLSGTTTRGAVAGVATFANLSIDKVGTGYRLQASAGGLTAVISNAFSINPNTATRLGFTVQPSTTGAGSSISPSVRVAAEDAFGNTATSYAGNITLAIATNPGGGALSGTTTVTAASGVAIFSGLSIDKIGTAYTLRATASPLTQATSTPFDIVAGSATQLVFTTQPSTTTAGATMATVRVTARDAQGNTATGFSGTVTVAIGTNPGGGTLTGTDQVSAVNGVAEFSDLSINRSGIGYTLTADAPSPVLLITSAAFDIIPGAASVLVFTVQPATTTAGATITPAIEVTARDALGNTATGFTGAVTMTIDTNPGGGTLSGTTMVNAASGVAIFSTLSIDLAGAGYRLLASATGPAAVVSNAFSIS